MAKVRRKAGIRDVASTLALALASAAAAARPAAADQKYAVRPGQSLEIIAKRCGSTAAELATLNGLDKDGILRVGQVLRLPEQGVVYVQAGQTLSEIAQLHHLGTLALAKANQIAPESTLQIGQKLRLPGHGPAASSAIHDATSKKAAPPSRARPPVVAGRPTTTRHPQAPASRSVASKGKASKHAHPWGKPKQSGVISLFRLWSRESLRVRLVDARGRVRQHARRALRELLRPRDSRRRKMPNARLLALLARVSDHFGGRLIHVVSGYRLPKGLTRKTSRHVAGDAIDFRIPGVPLTVLRDYCSTLSDVGVGYYPTTQFVHLDVRKQPARWTDWSLPGQPPVLTKPADYNENGKDDLIAPERGGETTAEHQASGESERHAGGPTG